MAMNIEQRLEQSAKSIEQSSQKAHDFAEKDTTIQTCAGSRDSLPKVSRIWQENFARQMNQHATEFQDRFALSQQSLPWQAGITVSDSLQRYHVGVQGEEGYKEFLPNPLKLPFETAATLADDLSQERWLENGVPNKHWTESKVTSALEKSLGVNARIWPKDRDLQVGDVVPSAQETTDGLPITHVIVDGNAYAMSHLASGLVSDLTDTGATIGGVVVSLTSQDRPVILGSVNELRDIGFTPRYVSVRGFEPYLFVFEPLSEIADNGGTVIKINGLQVGRYILSYAYGNLPQWFGAKSDGQTNDTNSFMLTADSGSVRLRENSEIVVDGFNTTGQITTEPRTGIFDINHGYLNGSNATISCIDTYKQVLSYKSNSSPVDNQTVENINLTAPHAPDLRVGTLQPGTLPDDHFAFAMSGLSKAIINSLRVNAADCGLTTYASVIGANNNSIVNNLIMPKISAMGVQADTSQYGIFSNIIARGVVVDGQTTETPQREGAAFLHGIRTVSQESIGAPTIHNRFDNFLIDNFDNTISIQTGSRYNYFRGHANRAYNVVQVRNDTDTVNNAPMTSVRCNVVDIMFNDVNNVVDGRNLYQMSVKMHGENVQTCINEKAESTDIRTKYGLNEYNINASKVKGNAILLRGRNSIVRGCLEADAGLSNIDYFGYEASTTYNRIDLVSVGFNGATFFGGNYNLIDYISSSPSAAFLKKTVKGNGNYARIISPEAQIEVSGRNNIISGVCRSLRDGNSSEYVFNDVRINVVESPESNPVILDNDHYTLNLTIDDDGGDGTACSILGSYNTGNICVRNARIGVVVGGDSNTLSISTFRADGATALQINGNNNVITVSTNGAVVITGSGNCVIGKCSVITDTGASNNTTMLSINV
ncbi:hypothetical protein [Vibrio cholerae]|uniref:hypothetical protein n=1 Tax=Vibrio cholerae TaxID=666 RepID=UPI0002C166A4|nr:hypothetical protein [Vibrio cholerae]EMQ69665.1 type V secretory pathway adhesin AidA domain protein [Vibrio cholerae O1 str. NHCC-008D]